ncbi:hypothetical protein BVG16_00055 [Paenibacillus selenitireducens]|uniref:Uncharacterized protein n=1 Tax=Paenibacillus selenitireducens TaxID=1324314 RepID=A0A1T2XLU7_9BACL|nr:hypothetical protein [Paenibacillus selenitireducens]OPA80788.1 hypothetical protein BVG16_00055 [Paenibacillus selenitireducens]
MSWDKELRIAIAKRQHVKVITMDRKITMGIPEKIGVHGLVTIRSPYEVTWVPMSEIKHVSRVIEMKRASE